MLNWPFSQTFSLLWKPDNRCEVVQQQNDYTAFSHRPRGLELNWSSSLQQEPHPSTAQALLPPQTAETATSATKYREMSPWHIAKQTSAWAFRRGLLATDFPSAVNSSWNGRKSFMSKLTIRFSPLCYVFLFSSGPNNVNQKAQHKRRSSYTRLHIPALVPVAALQQQKFLCCWQFPLVQAASLPDGHLNFTTAKMPWCIWWLPHQLNKPASHLLTQKLSHLLFEEEVALVTLKVWQVPGCHNKP